MGRGACATPRRLWYAEQGVDAQILCSLSGTGIRDTREWAPSATEALRLVRARMKLRRPGVRIEDERGNPVSFFQLKDAAEIRSQEKNSVGSR